MAASAIVAARNAALAIAESAAAAQALRHEHALERDARAAEQRVAGAAGWAALQARRRAAESRLARLAEIGARLGAGAAIAAERPVEPADAEAADYDTLARHVRALEAYADAASGALTTVLAAQPPADGGGDDALWAAPQWAHAASAASAESASAPPPPSTRLLARVAHLGTPSPALAALAAELGACAEPQRAELLTSELRLAVQRAAEDALAASVQAAQALVLEQTLLDLGYQVEGIAETLFVEGGVAHFRQRHWGDYMVRLRVAPAGGSLNFNVVRAVDGRDRDADARAQAPPSVQDHLAEDRWCAEFPALMEALAARGMPVEVTRRLEAGELPVQRVVRERLPRFTDEARTPRRASRLGERPVE